MALPAAPSSAWTASSCSARNSIHSTDLRQVTMGERAAADGRAGAVGGGHAQGAYAVEQFFARLQVVSRRRGRADHTLVDMLRVVHQRTHARMGFQRDATRQVKRLGRDVID